MSDFEQAVTFLTERFRSVVSTEEHALPVLMSKDRDGQVGIVMINGGRPSDTVAQLAADGARAQWAVLACESWYRTQSNGEDVSLDEAAMVSAIHSDGRRSLAVYPFVRRGVGDVVWLEQVQTVETFDGAMFDALKELVP